MQNLSIFATFTTLLYYFLSSYRRVNHPKTLKKTFFLLELLEPLATPLAITIKPVINIADMHTVLSL